MEYSKIIVNTEYCYESYPCCHDVILIDKDGKETKTMWGACVILKRIKENPDIVECNNINHFKNYENFNK